MKIFLSAGEVSGDVHGAALCRELRALAPDVELVGWGSTRMEQAGVTLLEDLVPLAAVGLTENLKAIRPAARALERAVEFLSARRPDAVVLIDYQGANMRLANEARKIGIPTYYYIAPQEWIWGLKGGPERVARSAGTILAVFEREARVYREAGAQVEFVGHPLLDQVPRPEQVAALGDRLGLSRDRPVLGLFPGSRGPEIRNLLAPMLETASRLRGSIAGLQVVLPIASPHFARTIRQTIGDRRDIAVVEQAAGMEVLSLCTAALAASGTITLEAAVCQVPIVAAYRVSVITAFLARRLLKIRYVTLPNIVAGKPVIPELLQRDASPEAMARELEPLLADTPQRRTQLAGLAEVRVMLGEPGATRRAAQAILTTRVRRID